MTIEALTRVDPADFATRTGAIAALDAAARAVDGHEALGDGVWRDLAHPAPDSVGFLDERAYIHVFRSDSGNGTSWKGGVVRLPDARGGATTAALLEAATTHVAAHHGAMLTVWIFGASESDDETFAAAGYQPARTLYEMRAALPVTTAAELPVGFSVRAFTPGLDESEWLAVNNRSFAGHADQGGWQPETFRARMSEPWFDPALFLLAFDHKGLAGFNWLKQHEARPPDPPLGEIYVIGVDPRAQGTGLGRALAVHGLHAVYASGAEAGMLFCAADNTGALGLYRSLGFTVHRTDRAYERQVERA